MGGLVGLLSLMFFFTGSGAGQPQPRTVVVPGWTIVKFWSNSEVNSATARVGDEVTLYLPKPLVVDGETILAAGYLAHAKVSRIIPATTCQNARLDFQIAPLHLPDSTTAVVSLFSTRDDPNYELPNYPPGSHRFVKPPKESKKHRLRESLMVPVEIALLPVIIAGLAMSGDHHSDTTYKCDWQGREFVLPPKSSFFIGFTADESVTVGP